MPIDVQDALINPLAVANEIRARNHNIEAAEVEIAAEATCRCARRLFAILAFIKQGAEIYSLLKEGVSDEDLPLERKRDGKGEFTLRRMSGIPIETFERWNEYDIEVFDRTQWWMIAPVFENTEHYELDDGVILPFIPFKTNPDTERKREGGYSEVYAVRIHPAHHRFWKRSEFEVWVTTPD